MRVGALFILKFKFFFLRKQNLFQFKWLRVSKIYSPLDIGWFCKHKIKVELKLRFEQILKNWICRCHWSPDKGVLVVGKNLGGPGWACLLTVQTRHGPKLGIRVETIPACSIVPSNTAGLKHSKAWMVGLLVLPVHFETRVAKCQIFYTEQIFQTKEKYVHKLRQI